MDEMLTCPYCGAERNSMDDVKCPECKRIYPDKEERLMGLRQADVEAFVEKNVERYIPIFKKNEGKKKFTSWNWSAALFPAEWMFYRKMYRQGALYLVIVNVISILLSVLLLLGFSSTLSQMEQAVVDSETWNSVAIEIKNENPTPLGYYKTMPEYIEAVENLEAANKIIMESATIILVVTLVTSLVINLGTMIITGLYGDCIYYHHVRRNATNIRDGGTSVAGMIGALFLAGIVSSMLETVIDFFVGIIF